MTAPVIQFKRGLFTNLPGLRAGEPGFTTDSHDLYVGIDSTTNNNKFFGSHRYWTRETTSTGSGVNLVEGSSNGTDFITLAAPAVVGTAVTYYFPAANGAASSVLTNDGTGNLSWGSGSADPVFTGIATFNTTLLDINSNVDISGITTISNTTQSDNKDTGSLILEGGLGVEKNVNLGGNLGVTGIATINSTTDTNGNATTGALVVAGGVGIAKSVYIGTDLTVGNHLFVGGTSEFVGVVTFKGGTINIGDENTDDINVGGEFISSLNPNTDNSHDLGITTQRWRTLNVVNINTTSISASGVSTFTGAIDANGGADISGGETTLSSATVSDLTAGRVVLAGTSGSLNDSANLTFDTGGLIVGAGGINVTGVSTFSTDLVVGGDIRVNGNDIQASDGNSNITLTSNTLTTFAGDIRVNGNDIQASDGNNNITLTSNTLTTFAGDIRVNGNDIQSSTGTIAITLADNDVTVADDLTVQGNLYVNGSTTQVNTASLTVEDRTIDLGIVNGAAPASATTWDLGVLFNYNSSGAKKSAVIWEHGDARFKFASVLGADTEGVDVNTPQLTVTTFAPVEIGSLWVTDCAGTSQVISCTGTERNLENITIDAGQF
jgi:hypothetical protein